jgi:hypothetical protein
MNRLAQRRDDEKLKLVGSLDDAVFDKVRAGRTRTRDIAKDLRGVAGEPAIVAALARLKPAGRISDSNPAGIKTAFRSAAWRVRDEGSAGESVNPAEIRVPAGVSPLTPYEARVYLSIEDSGDGKTAAQIREETGLPHNSVLKALRALEAVGMIRFEFGASGRRGEVRRFWRRFFS